MTYPIFKVRLVDFEDGVQLKDARVSMRPEGLQIFDVDDEGLETGKWRLWPWHKIRLVAGG